jgi:photosystem II stability/assembly factor-like uncharacterized protein
MKQGRLARVVLKLVLVTLSSLAIFGVPSDALFSRSNPTRWEQIGLIEDNVSSIVSPASNGAVAYAATSGFSHGVFRTDDGGMTWQPINNELGSLDLQRLLLGDPRTDSLVYALGHPSSKTHPFWKTIDRGRSWEAVNQPPWPGVTERACYRAILTIASNHVLIASLHHKETGIPPTCWVDAYRLTKSLDGGTSWSILSAPALMQSALAIAPSDQAIIYGAQGSRLYRSQDGGNSWIQIASAGQRYGIRSLTVHPQDPQTVYATTTENGIYKTTDGGQWWSSLNQTLPSQGNNLKCRSVVVHPTQPEVVFTACETHGVFWSSDGGTTWRSRNEGLNPFLKINSLAIAPLLDTRASTSSPLNLAWSNQAYPFPIYLPLLLNNRAPLALFVVYLGTEQGVWRLIGP